VLRVFAYKVGRAGLILNWARSQTLKMMSDVSFFSCSALKNRTEGKKIVRENTTVKIINSLLVFNTLAVIHC